MFKDFFLFLALAAILCIIALLVGSYLGNIPVKFELHWLKGSVGVRFYSKLLMTHDARCTMDDGH